MHQHESLPSPKPAYNPWDGYGLMILASRLQWIKATNPEICNIYDQSGKMIMQVNGEEYKAEIEKYRQEGFRVELQNNVKLIEELENTIEKLKAKIKNQKREE